MMRKLFFLFILLICNTCYAQYYRSSNEAYSFAQGTNAKKIERIPGPHYPGPHPGCMMCLGNHLISSHGYTYEYLNSIGWQQWETLHDNAHNSHLKPPKQQIKVDPIKQPIYAPTPMFIVEKMLQFANVSSKDFVVDLGCGDGRILICAAKKFGCIAEGYEIQDKLVTLAKENAKKNGVEDRVVVKKHDIFDIILRQVDILTLYLEEELNAKLVPQLKDMKPGSRIVSYQHRIPGIKVQKVYTIYGGSMELKYDFVPNKNPVVHKIYVWTLPLEKE